MQIENRKFLKRAMLAREFIFFTQYLGRVQLLSKNVEWIFTLKLVVTKNILDTI